MLEIACFDMTSAEIALNSVADRIEFCADIHMGGLTPNLEEFIYLKENYLKPIYIMIRPSEGGFFYSDAEFQQMQTGLLKFKNAGADGLVFGILTANGEVDFERNKELLSLAGSTPCTFHRAFDRVQNQEKNIRHLIDLGFESVLTSGGAKSAIEGMDKLKKLITKFSSEIHILIGGGVRSENIAELKEFTNGDYFHSSAIPKYERFTNIDEIRALKEFS